MSDHLIGSLNYEEFRVIPRGEPRPFPDVFGDGTIVYGAMRYAPVDADGNVTLSAEALRDLCNHSYRVGWRFGNQVERSGDQQTSGMGPRYDVVVNPDGSSIVIDGPHHVKATPLQATAFHTGRPLYRVECLTCSKLLHPQTTSVGAQVQYHSAHPEDGWMP